MIATRNGLSRSLHVGIYAIVLFFIFLYTLLFLYVVCCQNKIILILILIIGTCLHSLGEGDIVLASLGFPLQRCCIKCCPNPTRMVNICMIVV